MNSYFAGSLIALACALVLGALPRIRRSGRLRDAIVMGIGLAILADTRPYEGLVFSLPIAGAMLVWIVRQKRLPTKLVMGRVVVAAGSDSCRHRRGPWATTSGELPATHS